MDYELYGAGIPVLSCLLVPHLRTSATVIAASAALGSLGWTLVEYLPHRFAAAPLATVPTLARSTPLASARAGGHADAAEWSPDFLVDVSAHGAAGRRPRGHRIHIGFFGRLPVLCGIAPWRTPLGCRCRLEVIAQALARVTPSPSPRRAGLLRCHNRLLCPCLWSRRASRVVMTGIGSSRLACSP